MLGFDLFGDEAIGAVAIGEHGWRRYPEYVTACTVRSFGYGFHQAAVSACDYCVTRHRQEASALDSVLIPAISRP